MATCGYICPSCDGRLFMDNGEPCSWCQPIIKLSANIISEEEWIQSVHFGSCCSDPSEVENKSETSKS
jgi:hypothetical protein